MPLTIVTKRTPSGASGGATNRVTGAITQDITKRITGAITESITRRVPEVIPGFGPFLLLEGDFSGALAFTVNDLPDFDGYLKVQGTFI